MRSLQGVAHQNLDYITSDEGVAIVARPTRIMGCAPFSPSYAISELDIEPDTGTSFRATQVNAETNKPNFAGTISHLSCRVVDTNQRSVATTVTVRINGTATSCLVRVGAFETGFFTGTGTATFAIDDRIDGIIESAAQDTTSDLYVGEDIFINAIWCEMNSTTTRNSVMTAACERERYGDADGDYAVTWGSGRVFYAIPIAGAISTYHSGLPMGFDELDPAVLEPPVQFTVRAPGTFSKMRCYVYLSATDVTCYVKFRKNAANGNQSITILAYETGEFTASGTDAVVDGDEINYAASNALDSGGLLGIQWVSCNFAATSTEFELFTNMAGNASIGTYETSDAPAYDAVSYAPIMGAMYAWELTSIADITNGARSGERNQLALPGPYEFYNLRVRCGYHDGDPLTVTTYFDGHDGDQRVVIDGTGLFEDDSNYDDVTTCNGGLICYRVDPGLGGSCYARIDHIAMTAYPITEECGGVGADCGCSHTCEGAMTLCELKETVYKLLGEKPGDSAYWTLNELTRYINDAYIEVARDTKALEYVEAVALTEDDQTATLSNYVGQIFRVTFDDRKIDNTTKWELDRTENDWTHQSGFVSNYVTDRQDNRTIRVFKAPTGTDFAANDLFFNDGAFTYANWSNGTDYQANDRIYSVPTTHRVGYVCIQSHTAATATNKPGTGTDWETYWAPLGLMVWATKNPAPLLDCEEPELPPWTHLGICYRAAAKALLKYGEMRDPDLAAAYEQIAETYGVVLRGIVASRSPERVISMGGKGNRIRQLPVSEQVVED